jgi:DNA modification methylase
VRRVLREDGTLWLNLGDSYATPKEGSTQQCGGLKNGDQGKRLRAMQFKKLLPPGLKPKDLVGIPWRVAFALQADGWYLRQDIIWHKPNPMPESVTDRCTKAHEYVFLLAKSERYFYDNNAVKESSKPESEARYKSQFNTGKKETGGRGLPEGVKPCTPGVREFTGTRNRRSVWTVATKPFKGAHFAVMPPDLVKPCVLAGCPEGGVVLDPFSGAGTTAMVSRDNGRKAIGIEINPEYCEIAAKRLAQGVLF